MKKFTKILSFALASAMVLSLAACGGGTEETYRLEAEYGDNTNASLDSKDLISNGFFIYPSGGFDFASKNDMTAKLTFTADKAADATIVITLASSNTFGNEFETSDADYSFYLNGTALGKPSSIVDYEGNETMTCPKEDFTEGTGFLYATYKVKLNQGENTFEYRYASGNGAFKYDCVDITTTAVIEYTPNTAAVDNWDPNAAFGDFGGFDD